MVVVIGYNIFHSHPSISFWYRYMRSFFMLLKHVAVFRQEKKSTKITSRWKRVIYIYITKSIYFLNSINIIKHMMRMYASAFSINKSIKVKDNDLV